MTFDKKHSLRKAAMATVLAGAVLGAAALPAAARGFVSFGFGGPSIWSHAPSAYACAGARTGSRLTRSSGSSAPMSSRTSRGCSPPSARTAPTRSSTAGPGPKRQSRRRPRPRE